MSRKFIRLQKTDERGNSSSVRKFKRLQSMFNYVSLGDSIAAGHTINSDWEIDYGIGSQYGSNGNTATTLVPDCYTDRLDKYLKTIYGAANVHTKSFAVSGSKVKMNSQYMSLYDILDHTEVHDALKSADLITISIGANDILGLAGDFLMEYIRTGDLTAFSNAVKANISTLRGNNPDGISYIDLFEKLNEINPYAKYVFTTVHNPYKYLYASEGTSENGYEDSFFYPILQWIPNLGSLGTNLKGWILSSDIFELFFDRVNNLGGEVENYVTWLNTALKECLIEYNHSNFLLADIKALFDTVPDRDTPQTTNLHYNDLVNVEFTRNFNINQADWGQLYSNNIITDWNGNVVSDTVCNSASQFWEVLLDAYGYTITNLFNGDIAGLTSTLLAEVVSEVISKDADPHPEVDGHYLMYRAFMNVLGWEKLHTVAFEPGDAGIGEMPDLKVLDKSIEKDIYSKLPPSLFTSANGYHQSGWIDDNGQTYPLDYIQVNNDLKLTAQWSN